MEIYTENEGITRKYFTLLQKTFNILKVKLLDKGENAVKKGPFAAVLYREDGADRVAGALKLTRSGAGNTDYSINPIVVQNTCCKRAFLRGVFLAAGSISDPKKAYHLEIVFDEDVPTGVAINEAVELAKRFGQEESSGFVNGVLAKFAPVS